MTEAEHFEETGGNNHSLLDNNQVFNKPIATHSGDYARGQRKYSTGQHRIRLQLEAINSHMTANIIIGIISSNVTAKDQYFNQTPSTYAWGTSSFEGKNEMAIVENGIYRRVSKKRWPGAKNGDILQLTIDCDQQTISLENQTAEGKDSMKVDLEKSPLPWKFIVIFSTGPSSVRLL